MKYAFARRLQLITTLEIAVVFGLLVVAGALLALGSYATALHGDIVGTLDRVVVALDSQASMSDARVAGSLAASRYPRSSVDVVLIDASRRVEVHQPPGLQARPWIDVRSRGDFSGDPPSTGAFARVVLGIVTAFGVQNERRHVGSIDVIVKPNEASLLGTVGAHVWEFFIALGLSLCVAILLARTLTRQVLRPLVDVTEALERFAAGDLTPQHIVADRRQQLGSLAVAYNGAIAQMERAFGERDRANAAMRQFIADAGHQLRTPLTVVRGFISILRKGDLRTPQDAERILETMNRQSQIMGSLIEKLMLLDRWEAPPGTARAESIDVARLVSDVLAPIVESHPARTLRVDAPEAGLAAIDPTDLTHALTNVVDNALKYTHGSIDVTVRAEARHIVVAVSDEGPGMSEGESHHAFDRFFRGSRREIDGSGLGLAIARRAVERAGGTLSVESRPEAGSLFRIVLPRAERNEAIPERVTDDTHVRPL